ncbi:histidinol dehydrogenase [Staphylococcus equorum subsp. linens]|nr:histidinol dehydrogenase [Staphylococcus equorum]MCE5046820.1 histidinol dehydrogenase [Staphylococcus equorum]MDK9856995.1 histidinol dehydrogenase [Staphylococcus equorum]MDK9874329.1 histidinol dehydrogenase [Staphylococcus equorum]MEB7722521.1 histidinol dehydrogenase [Staphylococcus equorum]MEB7847079.1 histidinol dehydrogenase [Staphylococcus equorum]
MIINKATFLKDYLNQSALNEGLYPLVKDICDNVKLQGDQALKAYNQQLDHVETSELEIPYEALETAYNRIDDTLRDALQQSHSRIKTYQTSIKSTAQQGSNECYEMYHPLERVGVYVPGGKASYPSTVLMTVTLAKVAGVKNIFVVTPPQAQGLPDIVLAACYIAGVDRVFQVGGAQSIAALAYGTETIPKVDKIVGPGNQYVAYAKKYLFGQVGIDQIAGPSEIALIIDETADLDAVTYDVFAQAEHDELARTFVISENKALLQQLEQRIQQTLSQIERQPIVEASLTNNHFLISVDNFNEACDLMNQIAPEHASIQTASPRDYLNHVRYVGALFLGHYSPEVIGDYVAGPSHVLPTNQTARFTNGLSVNDFLTRHSVIDLSESTFEKIEGSARKLAHTEQLFNHEQSIEIRSPKEPRND